MKVRVTKKQIQENYKTISVGYCDLQFLLKCKEPTFYTCGIYGWNADIYLLDHNIALVTGYRPFGDYNASYTGICKKYDEKARKIYCNYKDYNEYEKKLKKLEKLLQKFVEEAMKNEE